MTVFVIIYKNDSKLRMWAFWIINSFEMQNSIALSVHHVKPA